jgi:hypothetical protein
VVVRSEHFFKAIEHCREMDNDFREKLLKLKQYRVLRDDFYKIYNESFQNRNNPNLGCNWLEETLVSHLKKSKLNFTLENKNQRHVQPPPWDFLRIYYPLTLEINLQKNNLETLNAHELMKFFPKLQRLDISGNYLKNTNQIFLLEGLTELRELNYLDNSNLPLNQ